MEEKKLEKMVMLKKINQMICSKNKGIYVTYCSLYKTKECKYTCNYAKRN